MKFYSTDTNRKIDQVILAETARLEREFPLQKIEPAHFEDLFGDRLERYDEDKKIVTDENEEQDRLATKLQEANTAFTNARSGDGSTRERERALQQLENAYLKYKEIISNINTGRKFYNDLAKIVNRYRDDCKSFVYQRRIEASHLASELENAMSALNLGKNEVLQEQKQRDALRSQYNTRAHESEPLAAPVPTRASVQPPPTAPTPGMWTPERGIKFGEAPPEHNRNVHNPAYPNTRGRPGQWDFSQGVRFG